MVEQEKKLNIEAAFKERLGFTDEEISDIKQAKEKGQNFPLSDEKWYGLPTQYRAYYWGYVGWVQSGKKGVEPEVPMELKKELSVQDSLTPSASPQISSSTKTDENQATQSQVCPENLQVPPIKRERKDSVASNCSSVASVFFHKQTPTSSSFSPIEKYRLYKNRNEILLPAGHPFAEAKKEINPKLIKDALSRRGYVRVTLTQQETMEILKKQQDYNNNVTMLGLKR
ncbi:MAG: hypothetical protein REH83_00195 [Rickettsiella sp.]|nr:hypothetical protein [Rickettsiella sp.]